MTTAPRRSASAAAGAAAATAPPPSSITGLRAPASSRAATAMVFLAGSGGAGRAAGCQSPAVCVARTSVGIAMWTGRGRCDAKTAKARAISSGTSSGRRAVAEKAVIGRVTAARSVTSCSSPQPLPRLALPASDESSRSGTEFGPGLADRGRGVGDAGARDRQRHAGPAGRPGIAVGHEAGALLVPGLDVAHGRAGAEPAVEVERVHARDAEDGVDAIGGEQADGRLAGRHGHAARSVWLVIARGLRICWGRRRLVCNPAGWKRVHTPCTRAHFRN